MQVNWLPELTPFNPLSGPAFVSKSGPEAPHVSPKVYIYDLPRVYSTWGITWSEGLGGDFGRPMG
eukprot:308987-Prorocentrum_minimum.AAC.2